MRRRKSLVLALVPLSALVILPLSSSSYAENEPVSVNTYGKGSSISKALGAPIKPVRQTQATAQAVPGPSLAEQVAKLTGAGSINNTDTAYQVMGTDLGM